MNTTHLYTEIFNDNTVSDKLVVHVQLNRDHKLFAGHFPEYPILPGVAMLQILKNIIEKNVATPLLLASINRAKFIKPVDPRDQKVLCFKLDIEAKGNIINAKNNCTFVDGTPFLHCSLTFALK